MLVRKLMAIDFGPYEYRAKELGCRYLPLTEIKEIFSRNADIIEILVPLARKTPNNPNDYKNVCELANDYQRKAHVLEAIGAKVIECPTRIMPNNEYKPSDDERLMVTTLITCMKLKPDYLVLFASNGDYAPMVEALREEGIRTVLVGPKHMLSKNLCRKAVQIIDYDAIVKEALEMNPSLVLIEKKD